MVSSAYCRMAIPLGIRLSARPHSKPFSWACLTILARQSATKLKRIGDKGSPCLTPLAADQVGALNVIEFHTQSLQSPLVWSSCTKCGKTPNVIGSKIENSSLPYHRLFKVQFENYPNFLSSFCLMQNFMQGHDALHNISSLIVNVLVIHLYRQFNRQIGLNCCIFTASCTLGSRVITP